MNQQKKNVKVTKNWVKAKVKGWCEKSTYREDANYNADTTKHGIANGVALFSRVADGLVRTVKPALVRLYGASLNDQERQASYKETTRKRRSRGGGRDRGGGQEDRREEGEEREKREDTSNRSVTQTSTEKSGGSAGSLPTGTWVR